MKLWFPSNKKNVQALLSYPPSQNQFIWTEYIFYECLVINTDIFYTPVNAHLLDHLLLITETPYKWETCCGPLGLTPTLKQFEMSRIYKTIKYRTTVNNKLNEANEKECKKSNFS